MQIRYLVGAIVVVALIVGGYFFLHRGVDKNSLTNYPSSGTDIVAFGDSLVYGEGASEGHDFVSLLSQDINQPIVNLGVPGDTTSQALARIDALDKYKPKVVILLVGGNDYLQRKDMTQAFINLDQIVANIQNRGAIVLLVGVRLNPFLGNFDLQFASLAKLYHTAYVPDAMDGVLGEPKYMSDNVHPNDAGYAVVEKRILPTLKEIIN